MAANLLFAEVDMLIFKWKLPNSKHKNVFFFKKHFILILKLQNPVQWAFKSDV